MSNSVSNQQLVVLTLNSVLPNKVVSDLNLNITEVGTPCISYTANDSDEILGDTLNYGTTNFTIKIWADDYSNILTYTDQVNTKMRELGFKLVGGNEMSYQKLICKILNYRATTMFGSDSWL